MSLIPGYFPKGGRKLRLESYECECVAVALGNTERRLNMRARFLPRLLVLLLLAACGGGSGSVPAPTQQPPAPPITLSDAEGFWSGTALARCDLWPVSALITHEGWLFASTPTGQYVGSVSPEPTFELSAVKYGSSGLDTHVWDALPDAEPIAISVYQGGDALSLRWSTQKQNFCTEDSTTLSHDPLYDRPASLALASGVYTNGDLTLAVNSDGVVSGSDINSCVFNGNVAVVHADRNYYSANIDVDNCPGSGGFEGVAFLDDTADGVHDRVLRLVVTNPGHALSLRLEK